TATGSVAGAALIHARGAATPDPTRRGGRAMKRLPLSLLALALGAGAAWAQDDLKVAVGARGVGETFVAELGQNAGIFKKHGLTLDVLYTQSRGETQQTV